MIIASTLCPKCGSPTFIANIDDKSTILCINDSCKWKSIISETKRPRLVLLCPNCGKDLTAIEWGYPSKAGWQCECGYQDGISDDQMELWYDAYRRGGMQR
jgi:ssDNA-binding Zn-finger/Zn-ribbon topoisomerase 1